MRLIIVPCWKVQDDRETCNQAAGRIDGGRVEMQMSTAGGGEVVFRWDRREGQRLAGCVPVFSVDLQLPEAWSGLRTFR
jgi:hypothetical protein